MTVAALFVQTGGAYYGLPGVECWDETRDARKYAGPWPVVAHPPCHLWTNFASLNFRRYGGGHNRPGNDGGCFAAALESVRRFGGVLEHPAFSHAWRTFLLPRPGEGWTEPDSFGGRSCEVWQSAYGHKARKRTWLYAVGAHPELNWLRSAGTHQIGWFDRRRPTLGKKAASATPPAFRELLLSIAASATQLSKETP